MLHPQARAVLRDMPRVWEDLASLTVETARSASKAVADGFVDAGSDAAVEAIELPGAAGPVRARVYRPVHGQPVGTLVWFRGGGFVMGTLEMERIPAPLAVASGCVVVSVEYRLAPEHPFPAGLEDCFAALRWVADNVSALGGDRERIAVGGDSAGGNLATAVALMARDAGGPDLAFQLLLYPMTARTFDGPSRRDPAMSELGPPEGIDWCWRHYVGERDGSEALISPLRAETLAGLPPAVVITAEYDLLRDEGEAYADRLEHEGVPVERRRYDGMPHGFVDFRGKVDAADECIAQVGAALRGALSSRPSAATT
jgi:acetyl esterase